MKDSRSNNLERLTFPSLFIWIKKHSLVQYDLSVGPSSYGPFKQQLEINKQKSQIMQDENNDCPIKVVMVNIYKCLSR